MFSSSVAGPGDWPRVCSKSAWDRAQVLRSDGSVRLEAPDGAYDRFVSAYVLDLLSEDDITLLIGEARRVLGTEGRLCLANLTWGDTLFSKAVSWVWQQFYAVRPAWVGGCRPIHLADFLPKDSRELLHHRRLRSYGITSEVAIARPRQAPNL